MKHGKIDFFKFGRNAFFGFFIMALYMGAYVCVYAADSAFEGEPVQPVEIPKNLDPKKIALGRQIFNDVSLSKSNTISCASCHRADHGGAVKMAHSLPGVSGKAVPLNVPTFFGSSLNFAQFWDGRSSTLEDQMNGPVTNPDEMGSTWPEIIVRLSANPDYAAVFKTIYGAPPTKETITDAVTTFERSQIPVNSPFDRYLRGDKSAISIPAQQGYELFKNLGCSSCHQGQNVGGNMFQKFGIIENYFDDRGNIIDKDYGRFNVTGNEEDRYVFKVPSLRNVELTSPYFHDGSAETLEKAVDTMAKYQLGRTLSNDERSKLVEFLKSLTGTIPSPEAAHE